MNATDRRTFFARFASLRAANPPHANDYPMLDRLTHLGLAPDQPFDAARLAPAARAAIDCVKNPRNTSVLLRFFSCLGAKFAILSAPKFAKHYTSGHAHRL